MRQEQTRMLMRRIREGEYVTARELAGELGLSEKTTRARLAELSSSLRAHGARIEAKHGAGYTLVVEDRDDYERFVASVGREDARPRAQLPQTSEDRVRYILRRLIESGDAYLSTDSVAQQIFASKQTVYQDLAEVERILVSERLSLERRPGYGIRARGPELSVRSLMVDHLLDDSFDETYLKIRHFLHSVVAFTGYHTTDNNFNEICLYIYAMLQRLGEGHPIDGDSLPSADSETVRDAASSLATMLEGFLGRPLPLLEKRYLEVILLSKRSTASDQGIVVPSDILKLAADMIASVEGTFGLDIAHDLDFLMMLSRHLALLANRVALGIQERNPMLPDIKRNFGLAWTVASQACGVAERHFGARLTEDEVGFVALIFDMPIEQRRIERRKKSIILVCATGTSSSQLLKYRFNAAFGNLISTLHVTSLQGLRSLNIAEYDYIFTTTPIREKMPIPVVEVGYFLESADMSDVRQLFASSDLPDPEGFFREDLFIPHVRAEDKAGALRVMCERVESRVKIDGDLYDLVLQREALANTSYGNLAAIPHPRKIASEESLCCVGILDRPIPWGAGHDVQVIFLISVGRRSRHRLDYFYQMLARFLFDSKSVRHLIKRRDYAQLASTMKTIGEDIS